MGDEWEVEEQLVVAEFSGLIDTDVLTKPGGVCKVLGVNSEQPMVQVGKYVFAGEYEDALGACVIFEEPPTNRSGTDPSPVLRYKCHTSKKLMLQRTFLSERKEGEENTQAIEILSLNEGEVTGRASTVCHYGLEPTEEEEEQQQVKAGEDVSDESDSELTEPGQSTEKQENATDGTENPDISEKSFAV